MARPVPSTRGSGRRGARGAAPWPSPLRPGTPSPGPARVSYAAPSAGAEVEALAASDVFGRVTQPTRTRNSTESVPPDVSLGHAATGGPGDPQVPALAWRDGHGQRVAQSVRFAAGALRVRCRQGHLGVGASVWSGPAEVRAKDGLRHAGEVEDLDEEPLPVAGPDR